MSESCETYKEDDVGALGVPVYFNIDYDDWNVFTFRAYVNKIGLDHTQGSTTAPPAFIGLSFCNLQTPSMDVDRMKEVTLVNFSHWTTKDSARIALSPLNRREAGITDPHTESRNTLLNEGKPKNIFSGRIVDAPGCLYGREWGFGDLLTISYLGQQYSVMVKAISAEYDENAERMSVVVEVQT